MSDEKIDVIFSHFENEKTPEQITEGLELLEKDDPDAAKAARALLKYSLRDVDYRYELLTTTEKSLVKEDEFNALVSWVRKGE